ncbi:MAG: sodium:solute symporter family protein [Bacteroidota bacterium]
MIAWLMVLGPIYVIVLGTLAWRSRRADQSEMEFLLGNAKLGLMVGLLTTAASLFSTFTLQGMPDFFRQHGVASWIFLAVADGVMIFVIVGFAFYLRRRVAEKGFSGVGPLLNACYETPWAGRMYFLGIFIFLIPYVSIQIKGITIFLTAVFPEFMPTWAWGLAIVGLMLLYSETGGLKAIIFADVIQAVLLLGVVWIIASVCLDKMGGMASMFQQVERENVALLSSPGPKGLLGPQFLFASMLAIAFVPITQPHITTRLVIMKSIKETHRMAIGIGIFAVLVILPTLFIGFYGAINYADLSTAEFLSQVLLFDQLPWVAALGVIGLLAAAISTSDSQLFAMGTEFRGLFEAGRSRMALTRIAIVAFAVCALIFSQIASDELALLALSGFSGTAILGPMILAAILRNRPPATWMIIVTGIGLLSFLASQFGLIPKAVLGMNLNWLIVVLLGLCAFFASRKRLAARNDSPVPN